MVRFIWGCQKVPFWAAKKISGRFSRVQPRFYRGSAKVSPRLRKSCVREREKKREKEREKELGRKRRREKEELEKGKFLSYEIFACDSPGYYLYNIYIYGIGVKSGPYGVAAFIN